MKIYKDEECTRKDGRGRGNNVRILRKGDYRQTKINGTGETERE